jgi:hypothetical protein
MPKGVYPKGPRRAMWKPESTYKRIWRNAHYKDGGLSFDNFMILCKQDCHYCGAAPRLVNPYAKSFEIFMTWKTAIANGYTKEWFDRQFVYVNGIDKKIPTDNYLDLSNLLPCCTDCNFAKGTFTYDEFIAHIIKIYHFRKAA